MNLNEDITEITRRLKDFESDISEIEQFYSRMSPLSMMSIVLPQQKTHTYFYTAFDNSVENNEKLHLGYVMSPSLDADTEWTGASAALVAGGDGTLLPNFSLMVCVNSNTKIPVFSPWFRSTLFHELCHYDDMKRNIVEKQSPAFLPSSEDGRVNYYNSKMELRAHFYQMFYDAKEKYPLKPSSDKLIADKQRKTPHFFRVLKQENCDYIVNSIEPVLAAIYP